MSESPGMGDLEAKNEPSTPDERPLDERPLDERPLDERPLDERVVPSEIADTGAGVTDQDFPVVAIGASAGGLEAIESFFDHMPPDTGAAFVVVQHLSPDFKSLMDQLISRHTRLSIHRPEVDLEIRPNAIYLIPPRKYMRLDHGVLRLSDFEEGRGPNFPIDIFFQSLAKDRKERAVAVVLSGTGTDGTRGVQAIKEEGGLVLVQDPEIAEFDGMPRSAIATLAVDFVLPPWEIAAKVVAYLEDPTPAEQETVEGPDAADALTDILDLVVCRCGVDFRKYRRRTVRRRIERRMRLHRLGRLDEYRDRLKESPDELELLRREVLIGVTTFFRDTEGFRTLAKVALPRVVELVEEDGTLRVWCIGCSTGEEAYSIAILLEEYMEEHGLDTRYKIFATDIDKEAISKASDGIYPSNIEADLSPRRLRRFFTQRGDVYQVARRIRERVLFAVHNLVSDPPFTRMHLVVCRNLLIYLQPDLQNQALGLMHFAATTKGILFLGSSETPGELSSEFTPINAKWKIFEKRRNVRVRTQATPRESFQVANPTKRAEAARRSLRVEQESAYMKVCDALIRAHADSGLVVNAALELVHVFGSAATYLRAPVGKVSYDLREALRDDLRVPVATAVRKVLKTAERVELQIAAQAESPDVVGERSVSLRIVPVPSTEEGEEGRPAFAVALFGGPVESIDAGGTFDLEAESIARVAELERELESSDESLRLNIEEMETVNEEMQSTNEELLAANEELQATNEELHSVNEELYTVNAEHQSKIEELTELYNDMENLLRSTDIGTVFLDSSFRIRKFTPAATQAIALIAPDIGRPFGDLSHKLKDASLMDDVEKVLRTGERMEKEVENDLGAHLLMRIHPYRTEKDDVNGVVLTFVDITEIEETQRALRESEKRLRAITENSRDIYWVVNVETLEIVYVSRAYERVLGQSIENLYLDRTQWVNAIHPEDRQRVLNHYREEVRAGTYDIEYRIVRPDGGVRWIADRAFPIPEGEDVVRVGGVAEDVTERVEAELAHGDALEMFRSAFDESLIGMVLVTVDGKVSRANSAFRELTGSEDNAIEGMSAASLAHPDDRSKLTACLRSALRNEGASEADIQILRAGEEAIVARVLGNAVRGSDGHSRHVLLHVRDVTARHAAEKQVREITSTLETQANNDPLTSLLNRRGLSKVLESQLGSSRRTGSGIIALLVDCDNFKRVNDEIGHAGGDAVLREMSRRFARALRPTDWIARIGGDEFLVLLPDTRLAEGLHVAEKIRRTVASDSIHVFGREIQVTVSVGAAGLPWEVASIEEILANTQDALRASKAGGKNVVRAERGDVTPDGASRLLLRLTRGHGLRVVTQPIWQMRRGAVVGYEMLSRGPEGPLERPGDLFRVGAERQVLAPLDLRCLRLGLEAARGLEEPGRVHVNIFPATLVDGPVERVLSVFEACDGLDSVCVEISEQQLVGDPSALVDPIARLRDRGLDIALDDVGFGRSSLETLIILEPDVIKVDRSMIHGVSSDPGRHRSLGRLLHIAKSLDADVIAEGVQLPEDKKALLDLGVELGQGFLWGHPYALN